MGLTPPCQAMPQMFSNCRRKNKRSGRWAQCNGVTLILKSLFLCNCVSNGALVGSRLRLIFPCSSERDSSMPHVCTSMWMTSIEMSRTHTYTHSNPSRSASHFWLLQGRRSDALHLKPETCLHICVCVWDCVCQPVFSYSISPGVQRTQTQTIRALCHFSRGLSLSRLLL